MPKTTPPISPTVTPATAKYPLNNEPTVIVENSPAAKSPKTTAKTPIEKLKKTKTPSAVTPSAKSQSAKSQPVKPQSPLPAEFMATEYKGISLYTMAMMVLIGLILWTGIQAVQQVQAYHQQYGVLQHLTKDYRSLQVENQRLLIEQQTFSATPQIASRAVSELNMFYPKLSDRMIIQANAIPNATTETVNAGGNPATPVATRTAPSLQNAQPAQIENGRVTAQPASHPDLHQAIYPAEHDPAQQTPSEAQIAQQPTQGANP